jgi:alpha-D-xyloside xylohydrolase
MKRSIYKCLLLSLIVLNLCNPVSAQETKDGVTIKLPGSVLKIKVCSPKIIRVINSPNGEFISKESLIVNQKWTKVNWSKEETGSKITIKTSDLMVQLNKITGEIIFLNLKNDSIFKAKAPDRSSFKTYSDKYETALSICQGFNLSPDEGIYGLGQFEEGNMNWRNKDVYVCQANRTAVNPFIISTKKYGILWDNYSETQFHDGKDGMSLRSEVADNIDYYFILGSTMDDVIAGYRKATGAAPMYPKSAYGYWQSKERYISQSNVLSVAAEFRKRQIPIDNIVQDWRYWGETENWSGMVWDKVNFPNPLALTDSLHNVFNMKLMNSIWPCVGMGTELYKELKSKGQIFDKVHWSGARLYDAYNPSARALYWKYLAKGLMDKGVDGYWMDGSEPEMTSSGDPYITSKEIKDLGKNYLGSFARYLNPYSLVHTQGVYEGQRDKTSEKRVYILTRSAFAGQQRYASTTWSGDIGSNWTIFHNQIAAGINFCMSGIPYWTTDIGGFLLSDQGGMFPGGGKDPSFSELYVRWFQFGAFCPIFRSHGTSYPREPWQFGDKGSWAYETILKYDNLRYRLMPYIYSLAWKVTDHGSTIMRGLPMDFPEDKKTYGIGNQYMFGPSIMVCPVTSYTTYPVKKQEDFFPHTFMFDKNNEQGKLSAEFYKGKNLQDLVVEMPIVEPAITWEGAVPQELKMSDFTTVFIGKIKPVVTGEYQFVIRSNGSEKLWVAGQLIMDNTGNTTEKREVAKIALKGGEKYDIRIENYQPIPGKGNFKLEWIVPTGSEVEKPGFTNSYLPQCEGWYDFWTGEKLVAGKMITRATPIEIMPLYVKAGAILPLGPMIQYATEKPADPIELRIYSGADGKFELYEDENDNYNYEKGKYSLIPIVWDDAKKLLTIGSRNGDFEGMIKNRTFKIVLVKPNHGIGLEISTIYDKIIKYIGKEINVKINGSVPQ